MADNTPQGVFRYPGVVSVIGGTFSIGQGTEPAVCVLDIAPQPNPPQLTGDLTIVYGGTKLTFPNCRVVAASYRRDSGGRIVGLTIEDYRWRWRFGYMGGRYNRREKPDVTNAATPIIQHTEKTPHELVDLCRKQLGENKFDVSKMPNDARPETDWDDAPDAAIALARLTEVVGCRVAPRYDGKYEAAICPIGVGAPLPRGPGSTLTDLNETLDPPEVPETLTVLGSPVRFQADFELEALALEADGEYVLVDEASYLPTGGWVQTAIDANNGFNNITDLDSRGLARASVYRAYRPKIPADGLTIPGYTDLTGKKITRLDQLVLLGETNEQDTAAGVTTYKRAIVYGVFDGTNNINGEAFTNDQGATEVTPITDYNTELAKKTTFRDGFSLDPDRNVITLGRPAISMINGTRDAAELRLRCAFYVRDEESEELYRYTRERKLRTAQGVIWASNAKTAPQILRHDEITSRTIPVYGPKFTVASIDYYRTDADKEADYYLDAQIVAWLSSQPSEATYASIFPIDLDGAISHVVITAGYGRPATMRVARNTEVPGYITPYRQRRDRAEAKALAGQVAAGGFAAAMARGRRG